MPENIQCYCEVCKKTMDGSRFYTSNNKEKYPPHGKLHQCKECRTMFVDNWDPATFLPILEEIDVPYIKEEWDKLLVKYGNDEKLTGMTIIGRYLSKMKLNQWKTYRWADSEKIQQDLDNKKRDALLHMGKTEEEIQEELDTVHSQTVPKPKGVFKALAANNPRAEITEEDEQFFVEEDLGLTEEDIRYLRLKWGRGYTQAEWVSMEQLWNDMCASYDIQTAGHKDTLKLICKTSVKANAFLDIGDIESYQKMSRVYDTLMKSGKFTAAQNKEQQGEYVDSVGELIMLAEKQGFIPRYYTDGPKDRVDETIKDMQNYVRTLVSEEMGLGDKIESAAKALIEAQQNEFKDDGEETDEEVDIFADYETEEMTEEDYEEFNEMEEIQRLADSLAEGDEENGA